MADQFKLYISKLQLNKESSSVQEDLQDLYRLHERLRNAFDSYNCKEKISMLYRVENGHNPAVDGIQIHVQALVCPLWDELSNETDYFLKPPLTSKIENIRIRNEASYHFLIHASPTEMSKNNKVVRLHYDQLLRWIIAKGDLCGFYVEKDEIKIQQLPSTIAVKVKNGERTDLNINTVRYSGILHVSDEVRLSDAMKFGIGRGLEFGCGLLSLAS